MGDTTIEIAPIITGDDVGVIEGDGGMYIDPTKI